MEHKAKTYDQEPPDKDPGTTVLIVDNEARTREAHRIALRSSASGVKLRVLEAGSVASAVAVLSRQKVHVILLDKDLGSDSSGIQQNGIKQIPEFRNLQPHAQILVVTGSQEKADQIEAMELGAMGFVIKGEPEILVAQINRAVEYASREFNQMVSSRVDERYVFASAQLAGSSSRWQRSLMLAEAYARSDASVLITGETGTGKSRLARLIHDYRSAYLKEGAKPFIALNVGALNPNLVESELFGAEKGAFTDSKEMKVGFFQMANHGTLFLDEIGNLSPMVQQKLLVAIEEKTFRRVGGKQDLHSECKIICATNENLRDLVKQGRFREDLLMRIAVLEIHIDPLNERKEDIPEIIKSLLPAICQEARVEELPFDKLPKELISYIQNTRIEGNIRGIRIMFQKLIPLCSLNSSRVDLQQLRQWRSILESAHMIERVQSHAGAFGDGPLTYEELKRRDFGLIDDKFPGMHEVVDGFIKKLFDEAQKKFEKNNAIARALKISKSSASAYLAKMDKSARARKRSAVL